MLSDDPSVGTVPISVSVPFEVVKGVYDYFGTTLSPLGLKLDYEQIKKTRPKIAEMLRKEELINEK